MTRIHFLNGGLANQTFQYILYRYVQLSCSDDVYLDDSAFWVRPAHNGYELARVFGVTPTLLSNYLEQDVWDEIIRLKKEGKSVPQIWKDMGISVHMLAETDNYREWNPFDGNVEMLGAHTYVPQICNEYEKTECLYLHAYGLCTDYYNKYSSIIGNELNFRPITDDKNSEYLRKIENSYSIALHIRRGDFVELGISGDVELYSAIVKRLMNDHPESKLFVFSDDILWCKDHGAEIGFDLLREEVVFVEGNSGTASFRDLQLMTECKGMVITNSSFDQLAALLNNKKEYIINLSPLVFD